MKKVTVAILIIGSFIIYSFLYNHQTPVALLPNSSTASSSSKRPSSTTSTVPATPTTTGTSSSLYKDGTYTGSIADAQWGNLQIQAVIQHGKITNVPFLQYPNDRNRSVRINTSADPQLTSEAIQAQSANVDIITGATDSSEAFIQSLSDALAKAKA
jgi:uncharacterized protein with FMN-binding domain